MPSKIAFTYAGGHSRTIPELDDAQAAELLTAQSTQLAAHIVHLSDDQKLVINFRQVAAMLITDVTPDPEPEPEPEPAPVDEPTPEPEAPAEEPAPTEPEPEAPVDEPTPELEAPTEEPAPEAPAEPGEDTRSVAELKAALDEKGVEYGSKTLKPELLELAKTNGV